MPVVEVRCFFVYWLVGQGRGGDDPRNCILNKEKIGEKQFNMVNRVQRVKHVEYRALLKISKFITLIS